VEVEMMPKIQVATLACLLLLLCSSWACSQGPSFDCAKATTTIEKMICADAELSRLDLELGRLYEIALKQAPKPERLLKQQRTWLKERDRCADVAGLRLTYQDRID